MSKTTEDKTASAPPPEKKGFSGLHVFGIVLLTIVATVGVGYWWLSHYVFPENFEPVTLNASEQDSLNNKLNTLGIDTQGGRTLRVNAGVELSFANGRPLVKLKGVSLMGVPIPNAWLGNLKNVDLVNEFGANPGFWQSFAAGVDYIQVEDGRLLVRLKE